MNSTMQPVHVNVSTVIDAPIDAVWAIVRDFNALPMWHPVIVSSQIEAARDSSSVGCIRRFDLTNGEVVRERLLELSDIHRRFSYSIVESNLGLFDYIAEFSLLPVTDTDRTFASWTAKFRVTSGHESEKVSLVSQGVFSSGFEGIRQQVARR